jgi:3-dehydrosphinganine reductase
MTHKIQHGTYLITGASRGIGRSIAQQFAGLGTELILIARDKKALQAVEREAKLLNPRSNATILTCDLSDQRAIANLAKEIRKKYSKLSGIINNAGYAKPGYFHELKPDDFEKAVKTDYLGAVYLTHALHDLVEEKGLITVTSSVVGYMGVFGYTSYAGPKFALIGFAETLRQELLARRIQVSVLCPPDTQTPGYDEENKTKPFETQALSEGAKLMSPDAVAAKFIKGVQKGKFIITCNFESGMLYRLHGLWPSLVFRIMSGMIKKAQKKRHAGQN